ncbi:MAG: selenide, water dikinase SelD, partial [archaeon]|nr:selenide, water dikinase SelD [archaeon]
MLQLLQGIGDGSIGMDCSIIPTRFPGLFQVSTTDFFFPLVEDPYLLGRIAACNVLSDMYALGLHHCDNVLMLLAASTKMPEAHRDVVTHLIMRGFNDLCLSAGTKVTGGQTTRNAWPLIGGVAMATAAASDFIRPELARPGDLLVLTKPLGTQVVVNLHQWADSLKDRWEANKLDAVMTRAQVDAAFDTACESMARLNRNAAVLMHKYSAHGATDVTGFGIKGHATNLCKNQLADVDFVIDAFPVIKDVLRVDEYLGHRFNL